MSRSTKLAKSEEKIIKIELGIDKGKDVEENNLWTNKMESLRLTSTSSPPSPPSSSPSLVNSPVSIKSNSHYSVNFKRERKAKEVLRSEASTPRFECYIGNLSLWTTDQEIENAMKEIGVNDIIEIKFVENRNNGISKGFCTCTVGSNHSLKLIYEKLTKMTFHKQSPIVKKLNNDTLAYFESRDTSGILISQSEEEIELHALRCVPQFQPPSGYSIPPPQRHQTGHNYYQNGGTRYIYPAYNWPRGPYYFPVAPFQQTRNMTSPRSFYPQHHRGGRQWTHPIPISQGQGFFNNRASYHSHAQAKEPFSPELHPPGISPTKLHTADPSLSSEGQPLASSTPTAPHINPKFFPRGYFSKNYLAPRSSPSPTPPLSPVTSSYDGSKRRRSSSHSRQNTLEQLNSSISNYRIVSSVAISRAFKDATIGDYESAIETLETAICLLHRSSVSKDDRVQMLLDTLLDTLEGIESKRCTRSSRKRDLSAHSHRNHSHHHSHRNRHCHESARSRYYDRSRDRSREYSNSRRSREDRKRSHGNTSDEDSRHHDRAHSTRHYKDNVEYIPRIQGRRKRSRSRQRYTTSSSRSRHSGTETERESNHEHQSYQGSDDGDDDQEKMSW